MMLKNLFTINIFVLSQYLDTITTIRGIEIYGTMIEGNPIVSNIFHAHGPTGFVLAKIAAVFITLVLGYFVYLSGREKQLNLLFLIISVVFIFIAIMNTTFLV